VELPGPPDFASAGLALRGLPATRKGARFWQAASS
jgi:hypothetical protein